MTLITFLAPQKLCQICIENSLRTLLLTGRIPKGLSKNARLIIDKQASLFSDIITNPTVALWQQNSGPFAVESGRKNVFCTLQLVALRPKILSDPGIKAPPPRREAVLNLLLDFRESISESVLTSLD